jgi:hypothetical protein
MHWIFETYSNVYNTALMQESKRHDHAANAKKLPEGRRSALARIFGRG